MLLLEIFEDANVCGAFGSAAAQHQTDRGTVLLGMDPVHVGPHLRNGGGIGLGVGAVDGKAIGVCLGCGRQPESQDGCGYECCPASIPQAASISSPLEALIVHTIPCLLSLSLNSSILAAGGQS